MSDFVSSFFTIANALVSPKAIIKFLSIALLLIITWLYISPPLSELGIPVEHFSFIILLIGIGLGSLLGIILSLIYDFFFNIYKKKSKEKSDFKRREIEKERDEEDQKIRNEVLVKKLESSIDYLGIEDKQTLYLLSQTIHTIDHREYNDSILLDNEYIQIISRVNKDRVLVELNPAILSTVQASFEHYRKTEVEFFLKSNKNAERLLELLDVNNSEATTLVNIDVLRSVSGFSHHIHGEFHQGSGYWLSFDRFMFEAFEEQLGRRFSEEFFIPIARIKMNDSSAEV